MEWTEIIMKVPSAQLEQAADMAQMAVDGGIYVEDYSHLEEEAREIAHIDLIDEELLAKDREHGLVHLYISPEENPKEALAFLRERCAGEGIDCEFSVESCAEEDWINNWKQYFKPFTVDHILIKPTWEPIPEEHKDKLLVQIDPGTAFGTGMHETTQLCIRQLEKHVHGQAEILDVGTGSGILGITALKLGAKEVWGTDLDENAITAVGENLESNDISQERFCVVQGNIIDDKAIQDQAGYECYDIAVANILAPVIIMLQGEICAHLKHGGIFITSGIINTKEADVRQAMEANEELEILETTYQGEWVSITARRK